MRGRYFAADARSVLEEGVRHVMRVFFRHYVAGTAAGQPAAPPPADRHLEEMGELIQALCDEEAISAQAGR